MGRGGAEPAEIEALYRARFRAFVLTVTAILGDGEVARDVVQDGFALALRARKSFRGSGSIEAWLWRIVINAARDRRRQLGRDRRSSEFDDSPSWDPEPGDGLRRLLLALPERQRLTIFLRYYADLSYDQIADLLGVKAGTVAATLNAAHNSLRGSLIEEVAR